MHRKEIIYPCLLHCCRETVDDFWHYIFEDLACGKPPYGAYFAKNFLCCAFRGKEFSYKIDPNKPITELYNDIKEILYTKLGLRSKEDMIAQRQKFERSSDELSLNELNDWNTIKRKEVRNLVLEKFVLKIGGECSWSRTQTKRCLSALLLALQLKLIVGDDIKLQNGNVIDIHGFDKIINLDIASWDIDYKSKTEHPLQKKLMSGF